MIQITPPASPEPGNATVIGWVIDIKTGEPLDEVIVRLAEVYREDNGGVFLLDHYSSPSARTDNLGYFIFENIQPGEYVAVVGDGDDFNQYDIVEDTNSREAKVWEALADQIADWGILKAEVLFR